MPPRPLSIATARRIALTSQGFSRRRPKGRVGLSHVRRVIHELGLLQIDYVNVLVPAHYFVLFSRLGPFDRALLDRIVFEHREFVEQWAHEASIVPMTTWPLLAHRREAFHHSRRFDAFRRKHQAYVDSVLEDVRARGPLSADDLEPPDGVARKLPGVWSRSVPRTVLDHHFGHGRVVASTRRANFMREFDLPDRVVPKKHLERTASKEESQRELLLQAARAHGISTAGDLADYWRMSMTETRCRLRELAERGALHEVAVHGWQEPAYLHPAAKRPRTVEACALVSPFDPVVWTRDRMARLFGFEYRLEIFVPKPKRRWGYYVLPFLLGDRLVARVDLKAERARGRLDVLASHLEDGVDAETVAAALAPELRLLADWLGLESVRVERRGGFARTLGSAVRAAEC